MHLFSRRNFLRLSTSGLLLPKSALADADERKFVFIFCQGGWDQCYFAAPLFDSSLVDMEGNVQLGTANDIPFVDSSYRPSVRDFFETYGNRTCLINGFESRSVAHDICLRLVSTGKSLSNSDDWPSIIAAHATSNPIMPFVSISGPTYTSRYDSTVVRVGSSGQLSKLLSGSTLNELGVTPPPADIEALEDRWMSDLLEQRRSQVFRGRAMEIMEKAVTADERRERLEELQSELSISASTNLKENLNLCVDLLQFGSSRSIMIGYQGYQDLGWDTHAANHLQGIHLENLFSDLNDFLYELKNTTTISGSSLLDNTTVVLLSEMGRFPQVNSRGGKEHWTFTSAIFIGSGIRGGQSIGLYNDYCFGEPVDLQTGHPSSQGTALLPGHIGATLLKLADIDSQEYISEPPIEAAIL
ncbi:MAG: DUF1501 domain-containing protein [Myxococcota bacterium]|nr:DUF1501 domain-containing protein [Myxococcota bacterium]